MPVAIVAARNNRQAIAKAASELGMPSRRYSVVSIKYRRSSEDWRVELRRR